MITPMKTVTTHGEFDPHIWLDPKRAIEQVENIRDGLIAADPEGEAEYTANAEAFIAELEVLDADISEKLAPFAGQTFVVFHDFASLLCRELWTAI
jgi:zinc transport system substrate-binding protein